FTSAGCSTLVCRIANIRAAAWESRRHQSSGLNFGIGFGGSAEHALRANATISFSFTYAPTETLPTPRRYLCTSATAARINAPIPRPRVLRRLSADLEHGVIGPVRAAELARRVPGEPPFDVPPDRPRLDERALAARRPGGIRDHRLQRAHQLLGAELDAP